MSDLDAAQLRDLLDYNADTGVFSYRKSVSHLKAGYVVRHRASSNGYIHLKIYGRSYLTHRLAWLWVHGIWPKEFIDHIDGDTTNNRIANLREATRSQNQANARLSKRNTSGYRGVTRVRGGSWRARIQINGECRHLGRYATAREAAIAYDQAALQENGEYAGLNFPRETASP